MPQVKAIKIGNSVGFAVPKELRDKAKIKVGNKYNLDLDEVTNAISISDSAPVNTYRSESSITPEFKKWLKNVLIEDGEILDELDPR